MLLIIVKLLFHLSPVETGSSAKVTIVCHEAGESLICPEREVSCPFQKSFGTMSQRKRVIELYKTLLALGRDYPQGYDFFRARLKKAFLKNRDETSTEKIEEMINRGKFVQKEIETLYMLRKYRTLKRRYNETE